VNSDPTMREGVACGLFPSNPWSDKTRQVIFILVFRPENLVESLQGINHIVKKNARKVYLMSSCKW